MKRTVIILMSLVMLTVASAAWAETQLETNLRMWGERQQAEKERARTLKNATTVAKPNTPAPNAQKPQGQQNQYKHTQDMLGTR